MKRSALWTSCLVALIAGTHVTGADLNVPAEFVKDCEYYLGEWATEVEVGGVLYRGKWTVRWSPEKACLDTHWAGDTPNGPSSGMRVQGWDASTKKVLVVEFGTDGHSTIERYTIIKNQKGEGEISGVDWEGKPIKAKARVLQEGPDLFTWTVIQNDKPMEYLEYRFRRVK